LDAREGPEEASMAAVAPREGERLEQPRQPLIEHGAVVPAGLVAQGASNPALADAGRADDEQVLMPVDPLAGDELLEQRLVEPARRLHVDILDDGILPEAGEPQPSDQPLVLALGRLTVDQQCEALLEGQRGD